MNNHHRVRSRSTSTTAAGNPQIIGQIDGASRGRLHGWVADRTRPFRRLTVEVIAASGLRRVALADRYRADVHQSGLGDGHYGFSVPLHCLAGRGPVRVMCIAPSVELGAVDLSHGQNARAAKPRIFRRGSYTLQIDRPIGRGYIAGWAVDLSHPERRRMLRLRSDAGVLAQQRATIYRSEITDGRCDGYHGFSFSLPTVPMKLLALEDIEAALAFPVRP